MNYEEMLNDAVSMKRSWLHKISKWDSPKENYLPNSEGNISLFRKNVSTFQQWDNFMNHVQGHVGKSAWSSNSSAAKINIVVQFLSQLCIIVVQKVYLSTLSQIRQPILGILWCQSLLQNTHRANPCTVEGTY